MEKQTINGTPIEEVFKKLKEDIPGIVKMTDEKEGKPKPYLDATIQRKFFEEVIPPSHYDFRLTDVQLVQLNSRACFVCTGSIVIYDDQRNKVVEKSYTGSNNCIISTRSGEPVDLAMDARNAAVSARKGCISLFGCGEKQLDMAKARSKGQGSGYAASVPQQGQAEKAQKSTATPASPGSTSAGERPVNGMGKYRLVYNAKKQTKDFPSMVLIPVKCREYRDFETILLIWKNRFKDVNSIVNRVVSGIEFTCEGKFGSYNNDYRIELSRMDGIVA